MGWPRLGTTSEPYACYGQYDAVMNAVVTGTKTKWTECSRKDLEYNYVYINSEWPSYLNLSKKEGTLAADPNACNPVNPTTPQPFTGHYETCVDKVQNGGTCFSFGPNGSDLLNKGGYCQFPSFMVDMCYNTCGYCTDPPVKLETPQGCRYLNITLKNNALIDLVEYRGIYEQDQYLVYGQPAWKKFDKKYGIWLSSDLSNSKLNAWMVGSWDVNTVYLDFNHDTKSRIRILLSDGDLGYPQEMTKWYYVNDGALVSFLLDEGIDQDDVTIQCLGCVEVKLENDVKLHQGSRAGIYLTLSDLINGKPSYRSGDNYIWFNNEANAWIFGYIDDIGSLFGGVAAYDNFGGLTDEKNVWFYSNGEGFKTAGTDDIIVTSCN